jgi:hypothetical protein
LVVGVEILSPEQVSDAALGALRMGEAGVDLFSDEALAASLRRAASFLCPATRGRIVRSVLEVLQGLDGYSAETRDQLEMLLNVLLGYGDLLELEADGLDVSGQRIFLGAPSFVRRSSGACLLIGVRPDGAQLVGDDLDALIDYEGHVRSVRPSSGLDELLESSGLIQLDSEQWLKAPRQASPEELLAQYETRLQAAGPSGEIEGGRILDRSKPVTYYSGRWRPPRSGDTGNVVARRPQLYGADLWCFARVIDGRFTQLVDLPVAGALATAHDEAWRLQAAIDAVGGHPQLVGIRSGANPTVTRIDFFSPLPSWAQRRLDVIGMPLLREPGSLFSYTLPTSEVAEELQFLAQMMWISTRDRPERIES